MDQPASTNANSLNPNSLNADGLSATQVELEAAAYRRLVAHLRQRSDVQNIDMMNLAGFCRNCLSKWYASAAQDRGLDMDYETARTLVYGQPYADWKAKHQTEATPDQKAAFDAAHKGA